MGVVGTLQFDVLQYRLKNEYNVDIIMESLPYEYLRWIESYDGEPGGRSIQGNDVKLVEDYKGNKLLLFGAQWSINWVHGQKQRTGAQRIRRSEVLILQAGTNYKNRPRKQMLPGAVHVT